jgi:16S rRNA (guanine(966)-N(2))-methyltransferase RsmD
MRIIGGKYKSRIINPGKKFKDRPTTDKAKEGLFNILENRYNFSDKTVLDLFSGSGSMGYEFISRGCKHAIMVEKNYVHFRFIRETLKNLEIQNAVAVKSDSFLFIKKCHDKFDIIFADPPYSLANLKDIPEIIFNAGILHDEGLLILEHPANYNFSGHPNFAELRKYSKVNFSFFINKKDPV